MNYTALLNSLQQYSVQLITMGGSISPYVGGAIALIITGLLIYLGIKAKGQAWGQQQVDTGGAVTGEVGTDQGTVTDVQQGSNQFFNGGTTPPPAAKTTKKP